MPLDPKPSKLKLRNFGLEMREATGLWEGFRVLGLGFWVYRVSRPPKGSKN